MRTSKASAFTASTPVSRWRTPAAVIAIPMPVSYRRRVASSDSAAVPRPAPTSPHTLNPARGDHCAYGYKLVSRASTVPVPLIPLSKPIKLVVRDSARPTSGPAPNR